MIRAAAVVVARRLALVMSHSILGLVLGVTDQLDGRWSSIRCRNDQETTLTKAVAFTFGNAGPHSSADATGAGRSLVAGVHASRRAGGDLSRLRRCVGRRVFSPCAPASGSRTASGPAGFGRSLLTLAADRAGQSLVGRALPTLPAMASQEMATASPCSWNRRPDWILGVDVHSLTEAARHTEARHLLSRSQPEVSGLDPGCRTC